MKPGAYEELLQIAEARHSTRAFAGTPVAAELVDKIVQLAKTSPYASGRKNWGIKVVDDPAVIASAIDATNAQIQSYGSQITDAMRSEFLRYSKSFTAFQTAPVLLVPWFRISPALSFMVSDPTEELMLWERDTSVKSISCVAMLITLAAQSLGLSSCYITGALLAESELRSIFKVPNGRNIGAIIPIGYEQ